MEIDRTERRILGSLMEKRWSTPDQYPLSLNALLAACNQKSNRDPALELHDFEVTGALMALREKGLVLIRERDGGRVIRYAERLAENLGVSERAGAVLAELMLRGPQTAPELLRRVPRMVPTESQNQIDEALAELAGLHAARLQPRQSGQRHARWAHLLAPATEADADAAPEEESTPAPAPTAASAPAPAAAGDFDATSGEEQPAPPPESELLADFRREISDLRAEVAELRRIVEEERRHPPTSETGL